MLQHLQDRLVQLREERTDHEDGFTLIELLVVVVIIGILIAIAIPLYLNYQKSSHDKAAESDVRNAISVLETCNSDNGSYPTDVGTTGGVPGGCTGQEVKTSDGTELTYSPVGDPPTSYTLVGDNTKGNSKNYCYNSANGGSVTQADSC